MLSFDQYQALPVESLTALYEALIARGGPMTEERRRVERALTLRCRAAGTIEAGGMRYEYDQGDDSFQRRPVVVPTRYPLAFSTRAMRLGRMALDGATHEAGGTKRPMGMGKFEERY